MNIARDKIDVKTLQVNRSSNSNDEELEKLLQKVINNMDCTMPPVDTSDYTLTLNRKFRESLLKHPEGMECIFGENIDKNNLKIELTRLFNSNSSLFEKVSELHQETFPQHYQEEMPLDIKSNNCSLFKRLSYFSPMKNFLVLSGVLGTFLGSGVVLSNSSEQNPNQLGENKGTLPIRHYEIIPNKVSNQNSLISKQTISYLEEKYGGILNRNKVTEKGIRPPISITSLKEYIPKANELNPEISQTYFIGSTYTLKSVKDFEITFQNNFIQYYSKEKDDLVSIPYEKFLEIFLGTYQNSDYQNSDYQNSDYPSVTLENLCRDSNVFIKVKGLDPSVNLENLYQFVENNSCDDS